MTTLEILNAAWAANPDFTDDRSNDYADRSMPASVEPIRRRNTAPRMAVECGHCGKEFPWANRRASNHVVKCERENRAYQYGRS